MKAFEKEVVDPNAQDGWVAHTNKPSIFLDAQASGDEQ
jgi:hypothetical protein